MKFTKEQAREKIVAKLGNTRKTTDRTIDAVLNSMYKYVTEDTEFDSFYKDLEFSLTETEGNLIKQDADFAKEWIKNNPKPTPAPTPAPSAPSAGGLSAEEVAAIVAKSLEPFVSKLGEIDTQRTTESIFTQAQSAFLAANKLDESNDRVKLIKDRVFTTVKARVGKDSKVEDITSAMKTEFDDLVKIAGVDTSYIPAEASGSGKGGDTAQFDTANKILQTLGKLPTPESTKAN